jgi:hypothetical protein
VLISRCSRNARERQTKEALGQASLQRPITPPYGYPLRGHGGAFRGFLGIAEWQGS